MGSPESEQARWFTEELRPHEAALRAYLHRTVLPLVRCSFTLVVAHPDAASKRKLLFHPGPELIAKVH